CLQPAGHEPTTAISWGSFGALISWSYGRRLPLPRRRDRTHGNALIGSLNKPEDRRSSVNRRERRNEDQRRQRHIGASRVYLQRPTAVECTSFPAFYCVTLYAKKRASSLTNTPQ
ncbi:unnamed protein product, partial [Ectocarpus sp. 12 AP-2014]